MDAIDTLWSCPCMPSHEAPFLSLLRKSGWLNIAVVALWAAAMLGIFVRAAVHPDKNTVLTTYRQAGERWMASKNIYKGKRGFVYSPPTAAAFVPLAVLPKVPAEILWRLLNVGLLLGGVAWWLKAGLSPGVPKRNYAWIFLLLLPLSLGNLNIGQVNPMVIGLLMAGFAACRTERWWLAALCITVAAYFKIYPLAAGLLLALAYPRQFAWRLLAALVILGLLSFVLQKPAYVAEQYRIWFATRAADDRFAYGNNIAPRDLWMLFRFFHLPITKEAYQVLQLLSGIAIGGLVLVARWRQWSEERLLGSAFALVCGWMLLCGPATESATYVLLAPAAAFALVQAFARPYPAIMRCWIAAVVAILLAALGLNSFLKLPKNVTTMSVQPMAALIFCGYALVSMRREFWALERKSVEGGSASMVWAV